jgi:hypothetical protein
MKAPQIAVFFQVVEQTLLALKRESNAPLDIDETQASVLDFRLMMEETTTLEMVNTALRHTEDTVRRVCMDGNKVITAVRVETFRGGVGNSLCWNVTVAPRPAPTPQAP